MMLISETLVNLICHCPCGKPSDNCVFKEIREMNKKDQITSIINLDTDEKVSLIKEHKFCLVLREANQDYELLDMSEFQDFI